jgi:hypothetical protein
MYESNQWKVVVANMRIVVTNVNIIAKPWFLCY